MIPTLLLLLLAGDVSAVLDISTPRPPRGVNTFDSYGDLNHSVVLSLGRAMRDQLLSSGYDTLVLDGGWSIQQPGNVQLLDENGLPVPDPTRFPHGMKALAAEVHSLGLKFGLWNIRGVHQDAVAKDLNIKGTRYSFASPGFVDEQAVGGGPNGSCLWAKEWLGVNRSHPAAQTYYDSRIAVFAGWDVDFLKADCMMCGPCYTDEMIMYTESVKASERTFALSYSPGGGNEPSDGKWVANHQIGTMYRIVTDFHGGWYGWGGLQQAIFIAGNFTAAGLNGANGTYPDLDMLPLGPSFWGPSGSQRQNRGWTPERAARGRTIITLDMISRSPLMHAGPLPADPVTLGYETNKVALEINADGAPAVVGYQGNCTCSGGSGGSCTIPHEGNREAATLVGTATDAPCMAVWSSRVKSKYTAMAVFNMGEANGTASVGLADVPRWQRGATGGLDAGQSYHIVDVWTGKATGPVSWPLKIHVAMHGAAFFKVVPSSDVAKKKAASPADPKCLLGILEESSLVCCAKQCGRCGGPDCGTLPGGSADCCEGSIKQADRSCDKQGAPCIVAQTPSPPPATECGDYPEPLNTTRRNVLMIGDSISMPVPFTPGGYGVNAREMLEARNISAFHAGGWGHGGQASNTVKGLLCTNSSTRGNWLNISGSRYDVVHFNFGLHDLVDPGPGEGKEHVDLPQYGANLVTIYRRLQTIAKTVIWTTTTPCPNVTTSMGRTDAKVVAYNAKAKAALAAVVGAAGLVVDDLYTKVDSYCGQNYKSCDLQLPTNVHFTAKGCQFMAEDVVTSITAALDSQHQIPPFR